MFCFLHSSSVFLLLLFSFLSSFEVTEASKPRPGRQRTSLNAGWRFQRFTTNPDGLSYDILKPWILPSGNDFILTGSQSSLPNATAPGSDVAFVQPGFDDSAWDAVTLPHDWAIAGPFNAPDIPGEMGRLPSDGVGWYRRNLTVDLSHGAKSVFLDIDGSMSYTAVFLNEKLVGGW